jgi:hypothetical protein
MGWARIDDDFPNHPKVWRVGPDGVALFLEGLCHAAKFLTDGKLTKEDVQRMRMVKRPLVVAQKLVASGLWEVDGDGFVVHDYLEYNPTAEDAKAKKQWEKRRREMYADPQLLAAVRARDGNACRYCGRVVNWSDRRGPRGGQFDHVQPRGPNSLENIVVACRECNCGKSGRTPEQAGYVLRPESRSGSELDSNQISSGSDSVLPRARAGAAVGMGTLSSVSDDVERGEPERGPVLTNGQLQHSAMSLVSLWNDRAVEPFIRVSDSLGDKSMRRIFDALRAHADLSWWEQRVSDVTTSTWCAGGAPSGWVADFWWMLEHADEIAAGRVRNHTPQSKASRAGITSTEWRDVCRERGHEPACGSPSKCELLHAKTQRGAA